MKKKVLLIGGSAIALLLIGCILILVFVPTTPKAPVAQATQVPTQAPTVSQVTPTPQATEKPTVAPVTPTPQPVTPTPVASKVTHGTPQLGGLFSDFYGKYGTPLNSSFNNSETWNISNDPLSILINAGPDANGRVIHVTVTELNMTTGKTWDQAQMTSYCDQFLPGDASEFNRVGDYNTSGLYIDYHSSLGEIVDLLNQGTCTMDVHPGQ